MSGVLRLAADGLGWESDGVAWMPPHPFLGVVGRPVDRSLSPRFQNAALRTAGIELDYHALDLGPEELPALRDLPLDRAPLGFNVTMPCKDAVAALCVELSAAARDAGVVNTVRTESGRWVGHNTDVGGVLAVVRERTERPPVNGIVLGSGGSARAAVLALIEAGAERIRVVARPGSRFEALAEWLSDRTTDGACVPWGSPLGNLLTTPDDVVVSCVPPAADEGALLYGPAPARPALWLDLRYGLQRPSTLDAVDPPWCDGLAVLLEQGVLAFEWWFDRPAPRDAMRRALDAP